MLNARGAAPRATMSFPLLASFSPILYATLCHPLFLSFSHSVFLHFSPPLCEHRYLWNLLHRERAAFRFARSLARSRLVSFRFVSSRLEEAPGTRNVSISVTVDGVPSHVSRLWTTGQRFDTCATSPDLHTANNNILAAST